MAASLVGVRQAANRRRGLALLLFSALVAALPLAGADQSYIPDPCSNSIDPDKCHYAAAVALLATMKSDKQVAAVAAARLVATKEVVPTSATAAHTPMVDQDKQTMADAFAWASRQSSAAAAPTPNIQPAASATGDQKPVALTKATTVELSCANARNVPACVLGLKTSALTVALTALKAGSSSRSKQLEAAIERLEAELNALKPGSLRGTGGGMAPTDTLAGAQVPQTESERAAKAMRALSQVSWPETSPVLAMVRSLQADPASDLAEAEPSKPSLLKSMWRSSVDFVGRWCSWLGGFFSQSKAAGDSAKNGADSMAQQAAGAASPQGTVVSSRV